MKSFAFSAALLASTTMALPTNLLPGGLDALPADLPACLTSGVIPSGLPLSIASLIAPCSGAAPASSSSAATTPTSAVTSMTNGAGAGQILTVLNQAGTSNIKMMAESQLRSLMSKLPLDVLEQPIGQVVQTAQSVDQLDSSSGSGLTQVTAVFDNGSAALIELTQSVVDLLSSLGLGQVGSLLGSIVGNLDSVTGNIKRDNPLSSALAPVKSLTSNIKGENGPLSGLLAITDLNNIAGGQNMLFQIEPTLLSLLGGLDLSTIEGPIGNVVGSASSISELQSKVPKIPGASFIVVQAEDQVSVLLIKVDSTVQGLLSTLGLGSLGTVIGSVVNTVQGSISQ